MECDPDSLCGIHRAAGENAKIKGCEIENIDNILIEIYNNKSCRGEGTLYSSIISEVNFSKAFRVSKEWQDKGAVAYGPFVINGTNCSRFVAMIARKSDPNFLKKLRLKFPFTISPSPKRNVGISNNNYYMIRDAKCVKIRRNTIKAYFTGIEIKR